MKTIYFIASEPKKLYKANCEVGYKKLDPIISAPKNKYFVIKYWPIVDGRDFLRQLEQNPSYIHYCGHGDEEGNVIVENPVTKNYHSVSIDVFLGYLQQNNNIELILLCSCNSAKIVEKLKGIAKYSIGFKGIVKPKFIEEFNEAFYRNLIKFGSPLYAFIKVRNEFIVNKQQDIKPIFRSKINHYLIEYIMKNKDLDIVIAEDKHLRTKLERTKKERDRLLNDQDLKVAKTNRLFYDILLEHHPSPKEVFWFACCKEKIAFDLAHDILKYENDSAINKFAKRLFIAFEVFEKVLASFDDRTLSTNIFNKIFNGHSKSLFIEAFERLERVHFECGKSEEFKIILKDSIEFVKSIN